MSITIETATSKLLEKLYEIEKRSFKQEAFSKREINYLLRDYNSISIIARIDNEVVGFSIGRIENEGETPYGHIFTIETLPSHRKKGIAQKLLSELETLFVERGASESHLEVRENNTAAINLYQKLGYKQVSRLDGYYGGAPGLHFKKTLLPKES